ncbi:hypothetical protein GE061_005865 [Apolygus lucorum]|uniref:Uncharacterized protein n=1 Tax=Apolygus lucorum TaxID=248454 RepID=A0A8S9WXH3_APOLU|nr:hypothetical protein GE061_005865 [Apolygus lucorum]
MTALSGGGAGGSEAPPVEASSVGGAARRRMEWGLRLFLLLATVGLTALASLVLSLAIMTGHWETIVWHHQTLAHLVSSANFTNIELHVTWYLDDRVARLTVRSKKSPEASEVARIFLVPMHGGIWTLCIALTV